MDAFHNWLKSALNDQEADVFVSARDLAKHFIRFNREISEISVGISDSRMAELIWDLYGSSSSYMIELSKLPPESEVSDFLDSVTTLYSDLFERRCSRFFSHLDRGSEPPNPLNAPCYMLWDMDCGIDSFRFSRVAEHINLSIRLLERLANSEHPATIESAIHGLGHMIDDFRDHCEPPLERILSRRDMPEELRDYAYNAIHHYIQ